MYVCDHCGKGSQVGMNVSHSHVRTKKRSKPNLHRTTLVYNGRRQTMKLCTKCLRLAKKKSVLGYKVKAKGKTEVIQTSFSAPEERKSSVKVKLVEKREASTLSADIARAMEQKTKISRKPAEKKVKSKVQGE